MRFLYGVPLGTWVLHARAGTYLERTLLLQDNKHLHCRVKHTCIDGQRHIRQCLITVTTEVKVCCLAPFKRELANDTDEVLMSRHTPHNG